MSLVYTELEESQDVNAWMPVNGSTLHLADRAVANGYLGMIPISSGGKGAFLKGWPEFAHKPSSSEQRRQWAADDPLCGWGYAHGAGKLVAFDLDYVLEEDVRARIRWLFDNVDGTPMLRIGNWPKTLVVYRAGHGVFHRNGAPEIYHNKGQTVFFGIHPTIKRPYRWQWGSPATRSIDDLPVINGSQMMDFLWVFTGDDAFRPAPGVVRMQNLAKGNGAIPELLTYAKQARIPIESIESLGKVVRSTAGMEGGRHFVMQRAVAYAWWLGHSRRRIEEVIGDEYLKLFDRREMKRRIKDVKDVLDWTEKNGKRGG